MSEQIAFADVLEAAEQLDIEAQADLVVILSRRLAQRGRERVAATVAQARLEFAAGQCPAMAPAEVAREAHAITFAGIGARPAEMAEETPPYGAVY